MKIERILVGTDRSETATRAVKWALDMARRYEAELIVLQAAGETAELERYVQDHAQGARWRRIRPTICRRRYPATWRTKPAGAPDRVT